MSAPLLLDLARSEDAARWPGAVVRQEATARRTYAARCALTDARDAVRRAATDRGLVPLPTVDQGARTELVEAGDRVAWCCRDDSEEAVALVRELTADGEFVADEVLDAAADTMVVNGLLALSEARTAVTADPSKAAEWCLAAVPHRALAVTLASADID
ncbi:hypothetical protein RI138_00115 [Streptomyces sp. C11-1]|uniref:Uncharacterized protein n=1 Tax=Streptomyces durocortorensis TaxID=2811104 RepID=A0ABY9VN24_9ACTN|nr:hypothetical protein [Streptomyces durocortorensis]WNF25329.1 hypothetical protein RI138_00115 [Streptomyces durocortorensis]